jgi:CheY-like chemotaxis protein
LPGAGEIYQATHEYVRVQEFLKTQPELTRGGQFQARMNKILIIGDDNIVANLYRNKLAVEGYQTEGAPDGETGLKVMRTFQPQLIILDLMLPTISGVDVIKAIRSEPDFAKVPVIVFFSTNQEDLIQSAWRAGANKCLSKSSCTPKDLHRNRAPYPQRPIRGEAGAACGGAPGPPRPAKRTGPRQCRNSRPA